VALAAVTAPAATPAQPSAPVTTPPAVAAVPDAASISATPAALAASITAMHRNGQTSALLRLDPPGLGTLSIHVALGHENSGGAGQVNLLMVPAVTQTAQLLNSGIDSLRQALAAAGLTLGQAQIGQGGQGGQNPAPDPQQAGARPASTTPAAAAEVATNTPGVRAYA
jgi:flagellar hook-length control protein FliK